MGLQILCLRLLNKLPLLKRGYRGFSTVSAGTISQALAHSGGLVDDLLDTKKKIDLDLPNAFSHLKSSGRTCGATYIEVLQKKHNMPKFLSVSDFVVWYKKVPGKVKSEVEAFLTDPINSVFKVEDVPGSLLQNPVKTFCWEKPIEGFFKLNTDGSFKKLADGSFAGGCAAVVRNHLGESVCQTGWVLPFASSSLDVEFIGVYLGLLQCNTLGLRKMVIESDCKQLVQVLNSSLVPEEVELEEYSHLFKVLASFDDYKILHQYREGNLVANELAVNAMALCQGIMQPLMETYDKVAEHVDADARDVARF